MGAAISRGEQKPRQAQLRPRIKTPPDLRRLSVQNGLTQRASPSEVDLVSLANGNSGKIDIVTLDNNDSVKNGHSTEVDFLDVSKIDTEINAKNVINNTWQMIDNQMVRLAKHPLKYTVKNNKVVRVFVSSTFIDSHSERNVLVKQVFPDLRDWCAENGLSLIEVDLRWGVPADTSTSRTIEICMQNLDECHAETNGHPFFISLIADRYGWIPSKSDLTEELKKEYHWVPNVSITHMEIIHGAYRRKNPNAMFFFRNSDSLNAVPEENRKEFQEQSIFSRLHLQELKKRLKSRFHGQYFDYAVKFDGFDESSGRNIVKFSGYDEFTERAISFLKTRITEVFNLNNVKAKEEGNNEIALAIKQEQYVREATASFVGRKKELEDLVSFVAHGRAPVLCKKLPCEIDDEQTGAHLFGKLTWDAENSAPLVYIVGQTGSGKSCLVAKLIEECQNALPDCLIFYHFVGLDGESCTDETVLKRLINFANVEDFDWNIDDRDKLMEIWKEKAIPKMASVNRKILIVLDGLDKLKWFESPQHLRWLPRCFPSNIKCIVSSGSEHIPTTCRVEDYGPYQLTLTPLQKPAQKAYVDLYLAKFGKKLDENQMELLITESRTLEWLFLACEELRVFGDFRNVSRKISAMPGTTVDLSWYIVQRLISEDDKDNKNGEKLTEKFLKFLTCENQGFYESYVPILLGFDVNAAKDDVNNDKVKGCENPVPFAVWNSLKIRLKPFLRFVDGNIKFKLYATQQAVRKHFLSDSNSARRMFGKLAKFYEINCRSNQYLYYERYPYCLIQSNQIDKAVQFLFTGNTGLITPVFVKRKMFEAIKCQHPIMSTGKPENNFGYVCNFCKNQYEAKNCLICNLSINGVDGRLCNSHFNAYMRNCVLCDGSLPNSANMLRQMASKVQLCSFCSFGFPPCCKLINNGTEVQPFSFEL